MSPAHTLSGFMDEGCPVWRPRGPSREEEEQIRRVLDFGTDSGTSDGTNRVISQMFA